MHPALEGPSRDRETRGPSEESDERPGERGVAGTNHAHERHERAEHQREKSHWERRHRRRDGSRRSTLSDRRRRRRDANRGLTLPDRVPYGEREQQHADETPERRHGPVDRILGDRRLFRGIGVEVDPQRRPHSVRRRRLAAEHRVREVHDAGRIRVLDERSPHLATGGVEQKRGRGDHPGLRRDPLAKRSNVDRQHRRAQQQRRDTHDRGADADATNARAHERDARVRRSAGRRRPRMRSDEASSHTNRTRTRPVIVRPWFVLPPMTLELPSAQHRRSWLTHVRNAFEPNGAGGASQRAPLIRSRGSRSRRRSAAPPTRRRNRRAW